MPLVHVREIYEAARAGKYGVSGFCAENMDMVHAIVLAAVETKSPVIVVLWEKDIAYAGEGCLEAIVRHAAEKAAIPVGLMLDHGTSLGSCLRSVQSGHTCVMMDASHECLEANVRKTREVCRAVHAMGILVEGEIGTIGRSFETDGPYAQGSSLTDPDIVAEFVGESEVDALAVSVGTESGMSAKQIDFHRLEAISKKTRAHLVIHGGSCTPDDQIRRAVQCGVTAFRFASENRIIYLDALEEARRMFPPGYPDTRLIYGQAVRAVKEQISHRMTVLGCAGKAGSFV